jgi:DNA polymerase-3 subunit delta'
MKFPKYFESKDSFTLYGLRDYFNFLSSLYLKKKLPNVLLLSGEKGSGKSTLVNHFLFSVFDIEYDVKNFTFSEFSTVYKEFKENIFSNIVYLSGSDFKTVKVEDIRNLKKNILQSTISNMDRFIILDDVEHFNLNSLNALLKLIEEPSKKNYFILINNKSKPLIETIKSRSLEIKILLNKEQKKEIIHKLINHFKVELSLDPDQVNLSPGSFLKFNFICNEYDISTSTNFVENLTLLLNLHKKNKDMLFINIAFFLTDFYFKDLKNNKLFTNDKIYDTKNFVFENINKYLIYNINLNAFINAVNNKLNYE